jgi:hypothetical protein
MFKEFCQQIGTKVAFCISVSPTVEWSSRESKLFDLSGNEKNIGGREER